MDETKQLIKIQKFIIDGRSKYYVTDQNDNVLRIIRDNNHMEWILNGDFANYGDDVDDEDIRIKIEIDTLYDINNKTIFNSIDTYMSIEGHLDNSQKYEKKLQNLNNVYENLTLIGKVVYLFETNTYVDNMQGVYKIFNNYLYAFNESTDIIKQQSLSIIEDSDDEDNSNDLYFIKLGKCETDKKNCLHFKLN